jgi:hypothetical protein
VNVGTLFVPVAVVVCVCVLSADPVKTGAATVPSGVTVPVPFVPAGVPALTALDATLLPVNVGVTLSLPPVVPTLPFAAMVPRTIRPFKPATSV